MSAKSSREIPSGFLVDGPVGFLGCSCDGPAVEEEGKERIERTSAAEAAMVHVSSPRISLGHKKLTSALQKTSNRIDGPENRMGQDESRR